ncbi:MAG: galactose-1-phosphate uridylyltransferase [Planctomycetes bacterium]|nr:galactose-1-phosphate uridylyltransferase [Planctomycetota bacterium]
MPELRRDPITGRWVIFSKERGRRPSDFASEDRDPVVASCPFCTGNEQQTPPELYAVRSMGSPPNTPGWSVRVVPNKYPALRVEGDLEKAGDGIYDSMNGVGAHEVFVEGAEHSTSMTALPHAVVRAAVRAFRIRMLDLKRDRRLAYALVFKNVGRRAGASQPHNHSQLIATPVVPITVQQEMAGARRFFDYRGRCIYCDIVRQERAQGARVLLDTKEFVALVPYAARFPFETWVLPTRHVSHFEDSPEAELDQFADALLTTLSRLERALGAPAYNLVIHTSPFVDGPLEHYHWHAEIMPRVTMTAGFEWGSGFYINPVMPEDAVRFVLHGDRT